MINIVRIWAAVRIFEVTRFGNNGLDRMDMALMFNLVKYRLQDTMCPPTKLYPEPDVSA